MRSRHFAALAIIVAVLGFTFELTLLSHGSMLGALHVAKKGTKPAGYYTCNGAMWNDTSCNSMCTYRDPVYGLNVCSNIDACRSCLQSTCNASCKKTNSKGIEKPA